MAGRDPALTRINRALRVLGSNLSLEVSPSGVDQAHELAGQLGKDLMVGASGG